jgi:hypothetical protein
MTAPATIPLGYAVGSGEPVAVPLRHLAVTGQTQESGKTTALEALVTRAGVPALAFVTKRGETSFAGGRRVPPYFRDRADWQFVTSIIDATLQEKNKFLRPWIMKICRNTRTLADVHREVKKALVKAKGINEGVYTQLDAYLDLIVPEIARVPMTPGLTLTPGLNVIDVSAYATPMQMLFIQSAIDWVNRQERHVVTIVPEAWEFIPEGKGSPVKASAVELVRKGAGIGNFIWVDSQDMAGVDKVILRGCTVWLIGVQREANEIKRNLSNIPAGIARPTAGQIARLEKGQFYACWRDNTVLTYVRPAWMSENQATAIAKGLLSVDRVRPPAPAPKPEEPMSAGLEQKFDQLSGKFDQLIGALSGRSTAAPAANPLSAPPQEVASRPADTEPLPAGEEALYQRFKARLIAELPSDPVVMQVVCSKPELRVEVERQVVTIDGSTLRGRIARLIADGWFDQPRTTGDLVAELGRRGYDGGQTININVGKEMKAFSEMGFFTRENKWYTLAAGMKVNVVEK